MTADHSFASQIEELAKACESYVDKAVGVRPDGTQDTLPLVDHYLTLLDGSVHGDVRRLFVPAVGAYFGEVIKAHLGAGRWIVDEDPEQWAIAFDGCSLRFYPVRVVLEVIVKTAQTTIEMSPADTERAQAALERLGDVRAEDYYRLTVRLEVLEQVLAHLVSPKSNASG